MKTFLPLLRKKRRVTTQESTSALIGVDLRLESNIF